MTQPKDSTITADEAKQIEIDTLLRLKAADPDETCGGCCKPEPEYVQERLREILAVLLPGVTGVSFRLEEFPGQEPVYVTSLILGGKQRAMMLPVSKTLRPMVGWANRAALNHVIRALYRFLDAPQ